LFRAKRQEFTAPFYLDCQKLDTSGWPIKHHSLTPIALTGEFMASLVLASILTGSFLSSTEMIFIILTSGPFFVGPWLFMKTWFCYTTITLVGTITLNFLVLLTPPLRNLFKANIRRYFLYFFTSSITGCALLTALVLRDLRYGNDYIMLLAIMIGIGLAISFSLLRAMKAPSAIASRSLVSSAALILLTTTVFFISDWKYTLEVERRTDDYRGSDLPPIFVPLFKLEFPYILLPNGLSQVVV
jgi:hypothetical protein